MDITLGGWTVDLSVDQKQGKPLAEAMGDEASKTVKDAPGFTPKEAVQGKPAKSGFTISGKLTKIGKDKDGIHVQATFTVWIDGTFANLAPVVGDAWAKDGATPEEALRAVTEARITKILGLIKAGRVAKVH
jgi:hypothetical protein